MAIRVLLCPGHWEVFSSDWFYTSRWRYWGNLVLFYTSSVLNDQLHYAITPDSITHAWPMIKVREKMVGYWVAHLALYQVTWVRFQVWASLYVFTLVGFRSWQGNKGGPLIECELYETLMKLVTCNDGNLRLLSVFWYEKRGVVFS